MAYPTESWKTPVSLKKTQRELKSRHKTNYSEAGIQCRSQAGFPSLLQVSGASGEELDTKEMNHIGNANLCMSKPHNYTLIRKQSIVPSARAMK